MRLPSFDSLLELFAVVCVEFVVVASVLAGSIMLVTQVVCATEISIRSAAKFALKPLNSSVAGMRIPAVRRLHVFLRRIRLRN